MAGEEIRDKNVPVIYKITSPSGKVYIGQTWNWSIREAFYRTVNCKSQTKLYNSLLKYGYSSHLVEIICKLPNDISQEVLDRYELIYWEFYKDCNIKLLNCREPGKGGRFSEESKQKLSKSLKGRKLSEEHRKKVTEANKSEEEREKRRIALKGHNVSEETRKKISDRIKEKWANKEYFDRKKRELYKGKPILKNG